MAQLPTNPADFSLADVLAFALTKPADQVYDYFDNTNCALCQFLRETGRAEQPYVTGHAWEDSSDGIAPRQHPIPTPVRSALASFGETFGALASRLEALEPEPSIWISADAYMSENARVTA